MLLAAVSHSLSNLSAISQLSPNCPSFLSEVLSNLPISQLSLRAVLRYSQSILSLNSRSIKYFVLFILRGNYFDRDIVKVNDNDDVEDNHYENYYENNDIFYDDYILEGKNEEELDGSKGRIVRSSKKVELTVYWARLVTWAKCVDRLSITLGSKISMVFTDPSDAEVG